MSVAAEMAANAMVLCGEALPPDVCSQVQREMVFDHGKWDPQCGDVSVLAEFPLVLSEATWRQLAAWSEALASEALAAEAELMERPELHGMLGLPRRVRWALRRAERRTDSPRYMRFDFHPTSDGWRISEVNSDVPGGFIESSAFPRVMSRYAAGMSPAGDPAVALADAIIARTGAPADIGLVHATAYTDDRQVMAYLGRLLEARGCTPHLIAPDHIRWNQGRPSMETAWRRGPLDGIIRFYPGEWLPNLNRASAWWNFFGSAAVPIANPASALLAQSKRFPLVWDALRTPLGVWRDLMPETVDPRRLGEHRAGHSEWVLKPSLGRVGEGIAIAGVCASKVSRSAQRWSRLLPGRWAAQRRFESIPVQAAGRAWHVCIGVFVIDGCAAGAYGRIAERPLIDSRARDAAVLVMHNEPPHTASPEIPPPPAIRSTMPHAPLIPIGAHP